MREELLQSYEGGHDSQNQGTESTNANTQSSLAASKKQSLINKYCLLQETMDYDKRRQIFALAAECQKLIGPVPNPAQDTVMELQVDKDAFI